jgi:hypothetical protein
LPAYEEYIIGSYYQNRNLKPISGQPRNIINVLRDIHPSGLSYGEISDNSFAKANEMPDEAKTIPPNTAYQVCDKLADNLIIIRKPGKGENSKRNLQKYYFEDYNYIWNRSKGFNHPFAPGYVQYDDGFLRMYERFRNEKLEHEIYKLLRDFLTNVVRLTKGRRSSDESFCENCGYDHRMRDILRASLLRLVDGLEMTPRYINFIKDKGIIDESRHNEILNLAQMAGSSEVAEQVKGSLVQPVPKIEEINKFLDKLPGEIYFMGNKYVVRKKHDLKEIVLNYIIEKYPNKIGEIQDKLGGHFISRNPFYTGTRGTKKLKGGYHMDLKSPRIKMLKRCETALRIVGLDGLSVFRINK